jgi:putative membrane protein
MKQVRGKEGMMEGFFVIPIFFLSLFPFLGEGSGYGWGMGPGMMGWGYGMWWIWPIFMLIFLVAVIIGIILLIRWLTTSTGQGARATGTEDSALEILRSRYARGEIDREEFEQKKKDLME